MIALLAKLVPFRDYLYGAIIVACTAFWFYHDHTEQLAGEAKLTAAVNLATAAAENAAQLHIQILNQQYANSLAKVSSAYEAQLSAATAQHGTDLQRLREYDAYRQSHPDTSLGRPSAPGAPANGGPEGAVGLGGSIEGAALELADALRQDDAQLQLCWSERDSLTGK